MLMTKSSEKVLKLNNVTINKHVIPIYKENILNKSSALYLLLVMFKSLCLIMRLDDSFNMIISASHFLFEVLPAVLLSKINKGSRLVVYLHHLESPPIARAKHNRLLPSFLIWFSQSLSLKLIKKYADVIFINALDKKNIISYGLLEKKTKIMIQGIDSNVIQKIKRGKDAYSACFLGRLSPSKGIFDLIPIWKKVCEKFPDAQIAIIGSEINKYVLQFKNMVEKNNLQNNIILLGILSEEKKYSVLKASKIFVFPSYKEGWGIAVCEAMACGLPVVAYDLPAYTVFKDNILKIPLGNKEVLAKTVIDLLSNKDQRLKLGRKAKHAIKKFNWDMVLEKDLKVYEQEFQINKPLSKSQ